MDRAVVFEVGRARDVSRFVLAGGRASNWGDGKQINVRRWGDYSDKHGSYFRLRATLQRLYHSGWSRRMAVLDPVPLFRLRQFLSERLIGGLGFVLLIEDQGLACAFDEIGNP